MKIVLSPQFRSGALVVEKSGEVLTINGVPYDFGPLPDGATLPIEALDAKVFASSVQRIEGILHITLWLPLDHSVTYSAAAIFPVPINNPPDGLLELPQ